MRRDLGASIAVQSARSGDRHTMSSCRVPPVCGLARRLERAQHTEGNSKGRYVPQAVAVFCV